MPLFVGKMRSIGCLLFLTLVSAIFSVPVKQDCSGPLISVIGSHYSPQQNCFNTKESEILRKFQDLKDFYGPVLPIGKSATTDYFGVLSAFFTQTLSVIHQNVFTPVRNSIVCTGCKSLVDTARFGIETGRSEAELLEMLRSLCTYFNIYGDICTDFLHLYGPPLINIINSTTLSNDGICSFMLASICDEEILPELEWDVEIPDPISKTAAQIPIIMPRDGKQVLKVLQLSDTHFDEKYVEGSWDECSKPLCCRDPRPDNSSSRAGKYGGWYCDIPEITLDALLEFVATNHSDIDHVIWTGDIPAHDIWDQTKERNLEIIDRTINKMKKYFPEQSSVLPTVGNHETVPGNLIPTPLMNGGKWGSEWLYDAFAEHWTDGWLTVDKQSGIRKAGFYKEAYRPGLVMLSFNSVLCYSNNWWLILDSKDAGGELAWLVENLLEAEYLGEKVHIMAHVPPGNHDCLKVWKKNYFKIIERFNETVVAQFFGHTHNDEFQLIYKDSNKVETSAVMFIGPSLTTYTYLNPGFRIYFIDGDHEGTSRKVLDYETWIMDLEESNRLESPVWKKLYSAKEDLGLESLEPQEWRKLYERLKIDDIFLQQYHRYFWKDSPKRPDCDPIKCRQEYLCSIVSCSIYGQPEL